DRIGDRRRLEADLAALRRGGTIERAAQKHAAGAEGGRDQWPPSPQRRPGRKHADSMPGPRSAETCATPPRLGEHGPVDNATGMPLRLVAPLGLALALLVTAPSAGGVGGPAFQTVRLQSSNGFSEPRETIDNSGNFWIESNAADNS